MTRTWSKTPPTEPGTYWCKERGRSDDMASAFEVYRVDSGALYINGDEMSEFFDADDLWLGPITPEDVARADAVSGLRFTPGDIQPLNGGSPAAAFEAQVVQAFDLDGQTADDARVGRMLREISEAGGHTVVTWERGAVSSAHVGVKDITVDGAKHCWVMADALERAHAEAVGKGVEVFNMGTPAKNPSGEYPAKPDDIKIEWEPIEWLCERCGVASASTSRPAPAEPDYEGMSDEELCSAAGVFGDIPAFNIRFTQNRAALRAALIAFLRGREGVS